MNSIGTELEQVVRTHRSEHRARAVGREGYVLYWSKQLSIDHLGTISWPVQHFHSHDQQRCHKKRIQLPQELYGKQICWTGLGLGCLCGIRSIHHLYTNGLDECVDRLQHRQGPGCVVGILAPT